MLVDKGLGHQASPRVRRVMKTPVPCWLLSARITQWNAGMRQAVPVIRWLSQSSHEQRPSIDDAQNPLMLRCQ